MPLQTTRESMEERERIEREWETERSYPLAHLSTARRSGLRFVKATMTDEEWTRSSRMSLDASSGHARGQKFKTSEEIRKQNADWYRDLVGRTGKDASAMSSSAEMSKVSLGSYASTSRVTLEDLGSLQGTGSKEVPFTLDDEEDFEEEWHESKEQMPSPVPETQGNIQHAAAPFEPPPILLSGDEDERQSETDELGTESEDDDDDDNEVETPPETSIGDMHCLLCKIDIPAADVPKHTSSILHQLSKNPNNTITNPLVPPTHYGLKANTNVGYGILQKLGWVEETGLGSQGKGRKVPVRVIEKFDRKGVGVDSRKRGREEDDHAGKRANSKGNGTGRGKAAAPLIKNRREAAQEKERQIRNFRAGMAYLKN